MFNVVGWIRWLLAPNKIFMSSGFSSAPFIIREGSFFTLFAPSEAIQGCLVSWLPVRSRRGLRSAPITHATLIFYPLMRTLDLKNSCELVPRIDSFGWQSHVEICSSLDNHSWTVVELLMGRDITFVTHLAVYWWLVLSGFNGSSRTTGLL